MLKRRKTSGLWNFFTPLHNFIASCNMCKCQLSYRSTISNLRKHIAHKHPTVSIPPPIQLQIPNQPRELVELAQTVDEVLFGQNSSETAVSAYEEESPNCAEVPGPSSSVQSNERLRQEIMTSYMPRKITEEGKRIIDTKLIQLFINDYYSFRMVENEGFKEFVEALNPNYEIPCRHTISKEMIPVLYEECFHATKLQVSSAKSFCITTDCWTSVNTTSFIAVTAHFINDEFKLVSLLLECSAMSAQHTSKNLAEEISRILCEWGLNGRIVFSVSDNASNIQNALKNVIGLNHFGCFAHTMNLLVNDSLNISLVNDLLQKIKIIVSHFRKSSLANDKLIQSQRDMGIITPLKLKQDVGTRWNSTLFMLKRFVVLEAPIRSTIALLDKELPTLTANDWKMASQLSKILKPFETVTKTISGEQYCSASLVIPLVNGLENVIEEMGQKDYLPAVKEVVTKLGNGLRARCGTYENSQTLLLCTFLDPRFKDLSFSKETSAENAKTFVTNALTQRVNMESCATGSQQFFNHIIKQEEDLDEPPGDEEDEFKIWSSFDKTVQQKKPKGTPLSRAIVELQRYIDEDIPERTSDPLEWWNNNANLFPHLSTLAKEKLCALATSVPSERLFSKTGLLITDRRNRLSENKAKLLLFLNSNMKLLKK